jgi:SAM-dependent methyltransferase
VSLRSVLRIQADTPPSRSGGALSIQTVPGSGLHRQAARVVGRYDDLPSVDERSQVRSLFKPVARLTTAQPGLPMNKGPGRAIVCHPVDNQVMIFVDIFPTGAAMTWYSKHDRILRKFVPSVAKASYNPFLRVAGNAVAGVLCRPFPELRELPPNHLCIRTGVGNRVFNNHVNFILKSYQCWLTFLSRKFCTFNSNVVELGCGCGGVARALREPWFEGTYVGVDIDEEMIEYCRSNFPAERFEFVLSPHKSTTYSSHNRDETSGTANLVIAEPNSKDFVYSISLCSHLLENNLLYYLRETYRILRSDGIMYMTFFCVEHLELGRRWTFKHRRGNAYLESARYPEAAVAYHETFMTELATNIGFRDVIVSREGGAQSELVARK